MKLRPYQQNVIDELRRGLSLGHRRQIVGVPTGGGKTEIAIGIAQDARDKGKKVLFITALEVLAHQSAERFQRAGMMVGLMQGANSYGSPMDEVIVAMIQTIRSRGLPDGIDLVVVDEAHQLHKAHIELMQTWNALPVIGLTATPMREDLGMYFTNLVRGPSIRELQDEGFLVKSKTYCPSKDYIGEALAGCKVRMGDFVQVELAERMNRRELTGDIVTTWQRLGEDRKTLVFCVDVAHSKAVRDDFIVAGVEAVHIDGYMPKEESAEIIEQFRRGEIKVLCSVKKVGIGFDVPDVGCLVVAAPTLSEMNKVQQEGRGARPAPGKSDFIILDHAANCLKHGLFDDFEIPDLTARTKEEYNRKKKESEPYVCEECGFVMAPNARTCPECGTDRPVRAANVTYDDGRLVEFGSDESGMPEWTLEKRKELYLGLKQQAMDRGYKPGMAYYDYIEKFGKQAGRETNAWRNLDPVEPTPETRNWFMYCRIKQRHSVKRESKPRSTCRYCGSSNLYRGESVAHAGGSLNCGDCGRHVQWLPKKAG